MGKLEFGRGSPQESSAKAVISVIREVASQPHVGDPVAQLAQEETLDVLTSLAAQKDFPHGLISKREDVKPASSIDYHIVRGEVLAEEPPVSEMAHMYLRGHHLASLRREQEVLRGESEGKNRKISSRKLFPSAASLGFLSGTYFLYGLEEITHDQPKNALIAGIGSALIGTGAVIAEKKQKKKTSQSSKTTKLEN